MGDPTPKGLTNHQILYIHTHMTPLDHLRVIFCHHKSWMRLHRCVLTCSRQPRGCYMGSVSVTLSQRKQRLSYKLYGVYLLSRYIRHIKAHCRCPLGHLTTLLPCTPPSPHTKLPKCMLTHGRPDPQGSDVSPNLVYSHTYNPTRPSACNLLSSQVMDETPRVCC